MRYGYRLAVEPPSAKELRLFGLAGWIVEGFRAQRRRLSSSAGGHALRNVAVVWSLLLVLAANLVVFWSLSAAASREASRLAGS